MWAYGHAAHASCTTPSLEVDALKVGPGTPRGHLLLTRASTFNEGPQDHHPGGGELAGIKRTEGAVLLTMVWYTSQGKSARRAPLCSQSSWREVVAWITAGSRLPASSSPASVSPSSSSSASSLPVFYPIFFLLHKATTTAPGIYVLQANPPEPSEGTHFIILIIG